MRAVLCGANGAMGKLIRELLGDEIVGLVSLDGENGVAKTFWELGKVDCDTVIDFSHHSAVADVLRYAESCGAAAIIGTTGHTPEEKQLIFAAAERIPVFYAGNVSLGIAVLCRLVKQAAAFFPEADIEIVETHHNRKMDAPSGTALMLGRAVQSVRPEAVCNLGRSGMGKRTREEIGIHAIRRGNVPGIHEVIVSTDTQAITLRHEVYDRALFADGALSAARFLAGKAPGLYTMTDIIR